MYILDGHTPVQVDDINEFARAVKAKGRNNHRVAEDRLNGFHISTVFLGVNHNWGPGPPLLFETMVFRQGSWNDLACERYATWDEAEAGHRAMVERVKAGELDEARDD